MAAEAHPTDRSGIRVSSVPRGAAARPPQPGAQRPHQGHPALAAEQEIRSAAAALSTCMHQMRQPKRPRDDEGAPEVQAEEDAAPKAGAKAGTAGAKAKPAAAKGGAKGAKGAKGKTDA
ncbi:hypothetical protein FNF28_04459 [Cafeteria roenbergensis]|uniref:Uncharacterized protein n=1 Tax=Cafeteria roenbergensis TaxID=33653 RepID=A0A5A8DDL2_CAFRO|nr:hypothetical protein FNF28_04459 [Cafeteria roenbergensis]